MTTVVNENANVPSVVEESNLMSTNVEQALTEWEVLNIIQNIISQLSTYNYSMIVNKYKKIERAFEKKKVKKCRKLCILVG